MLFYSPTTTGFYPEELRSDYETAGTWPVDAYAVTPDEEAALRAALIPPDPAYSTLAGPYMAHVRDTREKILTRITGIWVATDDDALKAACKVARQNLLDITKAPNILAANNLDDLKAAVLVAYHAIVEASPAEIVSAFNGVDA